jgi:hypothetical protein
MWRKEAAALVVVLAGGKEAAASAGTGSWRRPPGKGGPAQGVTEEEAAGGSSVGHRRSRRRPDLDKGAVSPASSGAVLQRKPAGAAHDGEGEAALEGRMPTSIPPPQPLHVVHVCSMRLLRPIAATRLLIDPAPNFSASASDARLRPLARGGSRFGERGSRRRRFGRREGRPLSIREFDVRPFRPWAVLVLVDWGLGLS